MIKIIDKKCIKILSILLFDDLLYFIEIREAYVSMASNFRVLNLSKNWIR